jgi:hypothetical protein
MMGYIQDPSLALYLPLWKLDGASFTSKDKHGHLCTATGALWALQGRSFDKTDDVVYRSSGNDAFQVGTGDISFLAWFKPTVNVTDAQHILVLPYSLSITAIRIYIAGSNIYIAMRNSGGALKAVSGSAALNQWTMAAGVRSGGDLYGFINGVSTGSPVTGADINLATHQGVILGAYNELVYPNANYIYHFGGLIGEVRAYNRALTPQEIQQNYLAAKWRYR